MKKCDKPEEVLYATRGRVTLRIYKSVRKDGYTVYQIPFYAVGKRKVKS